MFRLMAGKAKRVTHFYPLSMFTYPICPPPQQACARLPPMRWRCSIWWSSNANASANATTTKITITVATTIATDNDTDTDVAAISLAIAIEILSQHKFASVPAFEPRLPSLHAHKHA
eukprot:6180185-Pleurochrysis_carterae.AAC.1